MLEDEDLLIDVLHDIQLKIDHEHLQRHELPCFIVSDECVRRAKDLGTNDIMNSLIRYNDTIKSYFRKHTREEFINLLRDEDALINVLYNIQYEIDHEHLKRDELMYMVIDKGICIAEKNLGMNDIMNSLIRCDIAIDEYFKTFTREEFIDLLRDEDELINALDDIQYEIARRC